MTGLTCARHCSTNHDGIEFPDAPSLPYDYIVKGNAAVRSHTYSATRWDATCVPLEPTPAERAMNPRVVPSSGEDVVVEISSWRSQPTVNAAHRTDMGRGARARLFCGAPVAADEHALIDWPVDSRMSGRCAAATAAGMACRRFNGDVAADDGALLSSPGRRVHFLFGPCTSFAMANARIR